MHTLTAPDGTTRYVDQMIGSAPPDVTVLTFSWPGAIFGQYDVFHVHWPEFLVRHRSRWGRLAKRLLLSALLSRLALTRTPIVRTVHNPNPHEAGSAGENRILERIDRRTAFWILLQPSTPVPPSAAGPAPSMVIPHGHYRDIMKRGVRSEPGRILQFGLIRPYKGVETLITAFGGIDDPDLRLRIVGKPQSAEFGAQTVKAALGDDRVSFRLEFVADEVLADEIGRAQLVVLAYREMHNSGAALVALSLGRPLLVPRTQATADLAEEVGPGWVHLYDGLLDAAVLGQALAQTSDLKAAEQPNLDGRDWLQVGAGHRIAYLKAIAESKRARTPPHSSQKRQRSNGKALRSG